MRELRTKFGVVIIATLITSALYAGMFMPVTEQTTVEATPPANTLKQSLLTDAIESVEDTLNHLSGQLQSAKKTAVQSAAQTPSTTVHRPVSIAPKQTFAYDRITIPSIGLNSSYVGIGLTNTGAIDVPSSAVGRWVGSATPGKQGAGFYDGHTPGIFSGLSKLSVGSRVTITTKDGTSYHYTVVHRETVPLKTIDMKKALRVYGDASEGINLMTCAGNYSRSQGTYDARLVIYAVRA